MSFAKRARYYTNVGKVVMDFCEVCGNFDLDVLEVHHLIPRNNGHRVDEGHKHGQGGVIVLCANCHKKLHMMFGGQAGNPYSGPIEKDALIEKLSKARRNLRRNYKTISNDMKTRIASEYNSGSGSIRNIARKYRVSVFSVEKLSEQAKSNGGVFRDPPPGLSKLKGNVETLDEEIVFGSRLRKCLCGVEKRGDAFWTHVRECDQGDRDIRRVLGVKGL